MPIVSARRRAGLPGSAGYRILFHEQVCRPAGRPRSMNRKSRPAAESSRSPWSAARAAALGRSPVLWNGTPLLVPFI